jgi:hypothetical protein
MEISLNVTIYHTTYYYFPEESNLPYIVTCQRIAKQRVGKQIPANTDSWQTLCC